ncbi:MAG: hypothetical protein V3S68_09570 [Dehalococcoidia bacterium]
MLEQVTDYVDSDEGCLQLEEKWVLSKDKTEWRRAQIIYVIRNGAPAIFMLDLGPKDAFIGDQFNIVCSAKDEVTRRVEICETVGSARDIADKKRDEPSPALEIEPRDMRKDLLNQIDRGQKLVTATSTFGHGGQIVRGGA